MQVVLLNASRTNWTYPNVAFGNMRNIGWYNSSPMDLSLPKRSYYKGADDLTEEQQHKIMCELEDLFWEDPSILLPDNMHLLSVDVEALCNSPATAITETEMEATTMDDGLSTQ